MSKSLKRIKNEAERIKVAKRRIALNKNKPGIGTLAAIDYLRKINVKHDS